MLIRDMYRAEKVVPLYLSASLTHVSTVILSSLNYANYTKGFFAFLTGLSRAARCAFRVELPRSCIPLNCFPLGERKPRLVLPAAKNIYL